MRGAADNVLTQLRYAAETRTPQAFAYGCLLFDHLVARDPRNEVNLIPLLVAAGDVACDVGAHRGLFTYWLLRRGARVTAVEPNPHMTAILGRRFAAATRQGRLQIVEGAASNEEGGAMLHVPRGLSGLASLGSALEGGDTAVGALAVRRVRLDDVMQGAVDFIKVDVEGHEAQVFQGARRILETFLPTLLVEAEERHRAGTVAGLRALLEPLGYEGFFWRGAAMAPIAMFDPGVHQRRDALNAAGSRVVKGRSYTNNFFFAARPAVAARLRTLGAVRA